jgi:hypothetical protein
MGWGYCGVNSNTGEEMGYSVTGICSFSGCTKKIDHGLSYVCGGMHEGGEYGCGRYFCSEHLTMIYDQTEDLDNPIDVQICYDCLKMYEEGEDG